MSIEKIYNEIKEGLYEKVAEKLNSINITESFEAYKKDRAPYEADFDDWTVETEVKTFYEVLEDTYGITDKETIDSLYDYYILEDVYFYGEKHNIPVILYDNFRKEQIESQYNRGLLTAFERDLLILNI